MLEDRINELEKLKAIHKEKKINIIIVIVLIIILLISPFVKSMLPDSGDKEDRRDMDSQQIQAFNSKFISYTGYNKSGAVVKQLCTGIMSNNTMNSDDESKIIYVKMGDITDLDTREKWKSSGAVWKSQEIIDIKIMISSNSKYDIIPAYDEIGLIVGIGIIDKHISFQNTTNTTMNSTEPKT